MDFITLFLISIGLAMDAFAVSLTEGISLRKLYIKHIARVAIVFGVFQGVMPLIGWNIGSIFYSYFEKYGEWIAFILLVFVGAKMILDAREFGDEDSDEDKSKRTNIIILGVATSIDALAVGFSFSMIPNLNIYFSIAVIGIVTFILSSVGVYIGNKVGQLLGAKAEYLGGTILVLMGIKMLF
jgi:putative Mn2+ efflux pump MntP